MSKPLVDRIPFAKIVTVLAIVFGIALGLCGLNLILALTPIGRLRILDQGPMSVMGLVEIGAMLLSGLGLFVTAFAWVVLVVVGSFTRKSSDDETKL